MATAIKANFGAIFAQYDENNVETLKALSKNLQDQLVEAYKQRFKELTGKGGKKSAEVTVEVSAEPTPPAPKAKATPKAKAPAPAEKPKKEAKPKKAEAPAKGTKISDVDRDYISTLGLTVKKYTKKDGEVSDKCVVVRGDTKPIRKILKDEFGGSFNSRLEGGEGWLLKIAEAKRAITVLGITDTEI